MRALALILVPALLAGGEMPEFEVVDFGALGRVTQLSYADLDGDGRTEVLVFSAHRLRVYRPAEGGGYDLEAPVEIELDASALFYTVAQVDGDEATLEVVLLAARGLLCHSVSGGKLSGEPRLLLPARTLVTRGQEDDVHWRGFLRDLSGDHLPDAVLPTSRGYAVYYQRRNEKGPGVWPERPDRLVPYAIRSSVETGGSGLSGRLTGRMEVPDFLVQDMNGDGRPDLVVDDGLRLRVFPTGKDGRLSEDRSETLDLSPLLDASGDLPPFLLRDVNGDRIPDFVLSRRQEGITDVVLGGGEMTKPAVRLKLPGWTWDPRLVDLDGDGRTDLIVPSTPEVDVPTGISVMMRGKITVAVGVFLNTGDAKAPFRKEPDVVRRIEVRIRLYVDRRGSIRAAHAVLVDLEGDFDGDGRKDLVYREGMDELRFFAGTKEGVFAGDFARAVKIPDTTGFAGLGSTIRDLDGDGVPDVAIFYESRDRQGDRLALLLSGGAGKKEGGK